MAIFTYPKISLRLYDYLLSLIQSGVSFDATNTISGTNTAELNTRSGTVTYTDVLDASNFQPYVLVNALISPSSFVDYALNYDGDSNDGVPQIVHIKKEDGQVTFYFENLDILPTNADLVVDFIIIS